MPEPSFANTSDADRLADARGMDGRQLAEQATTMRADMRVLLMSGYTTDALVRHGVASGAAFLQKPFSLPQLSRKVRDVLDSHP